MARRPFTWRCGRRTLATVAAFLALWIVVLQALANSAIVHRALHADAAQPSHYCLLTLLSHGDVEPGDAGLDVMLPSGVALVTRVAGSLPVPAWWPVLPPGRAPPVV